MDIYEKQYRVMKMLTEAEKIACAFYQMCADKFPEHKVFWGKMAQDEANHVNIIREIAASMANDQAVFNHDIFDYDQIFSNHQRIKTRLEDAMKKDVSLQEALEAGLDIEESVMEKKYYHMAQAATEGMKSFLESIAISERRHCEEFRDYLQKHKDKETI